jgi:predicted nucleic acid-binding protein
VCRDPDDDVVLALARAAQADIVISGDDDLLCLGSFERGTDFDASAGVAKGAGGLVANTAKQTKVVTNCDHLPEPQS